MFFGSVRIAALMAPLLLVMTTTADASAVCERLNARLSNLPKMVASNANVRDYTGAIARQNLELRQARSDRRRLGCSSGSILVIGGPNQDLCEGLDDEIAQMDMNLETLKARRLYLISGGDSEISRRRIMAALEVNRCFDEQDEVMTTSAEEPELPRNIIRDLPPIGETEPMLRGSTDVTDFAVPSTGYDGHLRTLCVRTCDGAFFPISSNASPADFQRDAQACQRRCPGTETALYYHALETQETDQMVSAATGEPYAELPNAFAYKTRDVASAGLSTGGQCGCSPAATTATNQSTPDNGSGIVDIQTEKKPETEVRSTVADRPYDPNDSKVRVVGPSFLPPQESAIDLKHPAGPGYQPQQTN